MHTKKLDCEEEGLKDYLPEEAMNCILHCRSRKCFMEWYGPVSGENIMDDRIDISESINRSFKLEKSPLEPGEIDLERSNSFDSCHINEIIRTRKKEREDKKRQRAEEVGAEMTPSIILEKQGKGEAEDENASFDDLLSESSEMY